jgi:hypothetical protein
VSEPQAVGLGLFALAQAVELERFALELLGWFALELHRM